MSKDTGDRGPVIEVTGEFLADVSPAIAETLVTFHGKDGDTIYRVIDWSSTTCSFMLATPEGESMVKERGRIAIRDALTAIGASLEWPDED